MRIKHLVILILILESCSIQHKTQISPLRSETIILGFNDVNDVEIKSTFGENTIAINCQQEERLDSLIQNYSNSIKACSNWTKVVGGACYAFSSAPQIWALENYIEIKKNNNTSTYKLNNDFNEPFLDWLKKTYSNQSNETNNNFYKLFIEHHLFTNLTANYIRNLKEEFGEKVNSNIDSLSSNTSQTGDRNIIVEITAKVVNENQISIKYEFIELTSRMVVRSDSEIVTIE